jgi:hypothetical protein
MSRAKPARNLIEPSRAEPSRPKLARYPALAGGCSGSQARLRPSVSQKAHLRATSSSPSPPPDRPPTNRLRRLLTLPHPVPGPPVIFPTTDGCGFCRLAAPPSQPATASPATPDLLLCPAVPDSTPPGSPLPEPGGCREEEDKHWCGVHLQRRVDAFCDDFAGTHARDSQYLRPSLRAAALPCLHARASPKERTWCTGS